MALQLKCCVGGCDSTNHNEKLFCMPVKDSLRNLWMSFLVPTNPALLGLKKSQLMNYRVCAKHFDHTQFDEAGSRIRYSYPCLFTASEIAHGVPLNNKEYNVENEHNYCSSTNEQEPEVNAQDVVMVTGMQADASLVDHQYIKSNLDASSIFQCEELTSSHPSTSLSGCDILAVPEGSKNTPNLSFAQIKTGKSVKNSKSRKFMKKCTDIINKSLGTSGLRRLHKAQNIAENCDIMEGFSSMTKKCQAFLLMQMRLLRKKKMERRFSLDEKLFALTLLKQYKHLDSSSKHDSMKNTAEAVEFFDDLFDSVNGSSGGTKWKLRCAVKRNSVHRESWRTSIQVLHNIEFIDAKSKHVIKSGAPRNVRVPSLDGWIVTLEIDGHWRVSWVYPNYLLFKEYGLDYFYPRYINQDPLENFFGRIRAINYRNVNPDVNTFGYAFKSLIMSNIKSTFGICKLRRQW